MKTERAILFVSMPKALHTWLKRKAAADGRSMSNYARKLLEEKQKADAR